MNKITKFLLIVASILLVVYLFINGYIKESENISKLMGSKVGGGELSTRDYYSLAQCVETYTNYLAKKDYETAYKMLNNNYHTYVSFHDYKERVSKRDNTKTIIEDIEAITPTTFCVTTNTSGEKERISIIVNKDNNNFLLLPYSFLDYKTTNLKVRQKGLQCILKEYVVNTNEIIFHFEFTNNTNSEIKIQNGMLNTNFEDKITQEINLSIAPQETKEYALSFETEYMFPKRVILYRSNGEKSNLEYIFEVKE